MVEWSKNATLGGVCFVKVTFYLNVLPSCLVNDKITQTGYFSQMNPYQENTLPERMIFCDVCRTLFHTAL